MYCRPCQFWLPCDPSALLELHRRRLCSIRLFWKIEVLRLNRLRPGRTSRSACLLPSLGQRSLLWLLAFHSPLWLLVSQLGFGSSWLSELDKQRWKSEPSSPFVRDRLPSTFGSSYLAGRDTLPLRFDSFLAFGLPTVPSVIFLAPPPPAGCPVA